MKTHRSLYLVTAIWELLRFLLLFLAVWIIFRQVLESNRQGVYWLLVLASGTLVIAAALLFLFVDPERFWPFLNLVRLGKILGLLSSGLLILLEPVGTGFRFLSPPFSPRGVAPFTILLGLCVVDLILLFLLFSHQQKKLPPAAAPTGQEQREDPLPEYSETVLPKS